MLATKVLASGITHLTDARYFAAWEVDYLAFPLGNGVGEAITWDYLNALREWVEGPTIVAELGEIEDGAAWAKVLVEQKITTVLIDSTTSEAASEQLQAAGIQVISHVKVAGYQSAEDVAEAVNTHPEAELVMLDFEAGGITYADLEKGHPFDLDALNDLLELRPALLQISAAGVDASTLAEAHMLAGFSVRGSSEEKVGYKSFDDLDLLFESLEVFE